MKYQIKPTDRGDHILESVVPTSFAGNAVNYVFRGRLEDCEKVKNELVGVPSQNQIEAGSTLPFPNIKPESWERYRTIDEDGYVMGWEEMPRTNAIERGYEWTIGEFKLLGEILDYGGSKIIWDIRR